MSKALLEIRGCHQQTHINFLGNQRHKTTD